MGIPFPGGIRGRGRRHARLCARRSRSSRGWTPRWRSPCARTSRSARRRSTCSAARSRSREWMPTLCSRGAPRRVRPHRAPGGNRRRQHADPRAPGRRRVGDRRRQAVHHQRGHFDLGACHDHRAHRRGGDLEPDRAQRHAGVRAGRALPEARVERLRHARRCASAERACPTRTCSAYARSRAAPVPHRARRRAHRGRGDGCRPRPGGARPGARLRASERHAFGQAISRFQTIGAKLADMSDRDRGGAPAGLPRRLREGSRPEVHAHRRAGEAEDRAACGALRRGGACRSTAATASWRSTRCARFYRDAKILTIGEGTDEVQQMVIAKALGA